jgi:hypothetical protein
MGGHIELETGSRRFLPIQLLDGRLVSFIAASSLVRGWRSEARGIWPCETLAGPTNVHEKSKGVHSKVRCPLGEYWPTKALRISSAFCSLQLCLPLTLPLKPQLHGAPRLLPALFKVKLDAIYHPLQASPRAPRAPPLTSPTLIGGVRRTVQRRQMAATGTVPIVLLPSPFRRNGIP